MAKRLQVVLNETVNKLGKTGDLVEVAPVTLEITCFLKKSA
jgi:Ribosomal protein L9, N-terminal domain